MEDSERLENKIGRVDSLEGRKEVFIVNASDVQIASNSSIIRQGDILYALQGSAAIIQLGPNQTIPFSGFIKIANNHTITLDATFLESIIDELKQSSKDEPLDIGSSSSLDVIKKIAQFPTTSADSDTDDQVESTASLVFRQERVSVNHRESLPQSGFETTPLENPNSLNNTRSTPSNFIPSRAPEGQDTTVTLNEDSPYFFRSTDFGFSDIDGDTWTGVIIDSLPNPSDGVLMFDGSAVTSGQSIAASAIGQLRFMPTADAHGNALTRFTFRVEDDGRTTAGGQTTDQTPNTIVFNVSATDDSFTDANETRSVGEDTGANVGNVLIGTSSVDGPVTVTTFQISGDPTVYQADGTGTGNSAVISGVGNFQLTTDGNYSFTPAANYNGAVPIVTYTSSDGSGADDTSTLTLSVTPDIEVSAQNALITTNNNQQASTGLLSTVYRTPTLDLDGAGGSASGLEGLLGVAADSTARLTSGLGEGLINDTYTTNSLSVDDLQVLTGLIYLEAGHVYEFSGYRDDMLHIELGGQVMATTVGNSFGAFNSGINDNGGYGSISWSSFTAPVDGYYTLEAYAGNTSGSGSIMLNLSDNGENKILSADNYPLYTGTEDLLALGLHFAEFTANDGPSVSASNLSGPAGNGNSAVTSTTLGTNTDGGYFSATTSNALVGAGSVNNAIDLTGFRIETFGSDTLSSITISNLSVGAVLSDGTNNFTASVGNTSVNIADWSLDNLTINVSAVSPVPSAGSVLSLGMSITTTSSTNDTATTVSTIDVGIQAAAFTTDSSNGHSVDSDISADPLNDTDDNLLLGTNGNDVITANTQAGVILHGLSGNDTLTGADDNTSDSTTNGNNTLYGGAGNDNIIGGSGKDFIFGGVGSDTLRGGFANGNAETDTDTFIWQSGDQGNGSNGNNIEIDTILDFNVGAVSSGGDILDFSSLLSNESSNTISNYISLADNGTNTTLSLDIEGDGSGTDLTVVLNDVTGTSLNTLIANGNIVFDTDENILRGLSTVGDTINGTSADEIIYENGSTGSAASLRGEGGNDIYKFEADDTYTGSPFFRMRDFRYGDVNTDSDADILDLADLLVGATNATVDDYINIEFNFFGAIESIQIYINGGAPNAASGSFDFEMELHGIDLNDISNTAGFAANAAAYSAIDEAAILTHLINNGNLIVE